jgi:hypothetical protein
MLAREEDRLRAKELDGAIRDGAEVTELTELYEVQGCPPDMRVICRREHPHPGARLSLFDTHARWRDTCFITNTKGRDIAALELPHRGHARVEDRVGTWKACGLANLPFDGFYANQAGGGLLARRCTAGLEPDDVFRRCTGQVRAQDLALPGPPCRRRPRPPRQSRLALLRAH